MYLNRFARQGSGFLLVEHGRRLVWLGQGVQKGGALLTDLLVGILPMFLLDVLDQSI